MVSNRECLVHESALEAYLAEIGKYPLLTREQEISLGTRSRHGDLQARDELITGNLRLVVKIAYRWEWSKVGIIDLIHAGNEGLLDAVIKYDPSLSKFSVHASFRIKKEIERFTRRNIKTVRDTNWEGPVAGRVRMTYLDAPVNGESDGSFYSFFGNGTEAPDVISSRKSDFFYLRSTIRRLLTSREMEVILARYGICSGEEKKTLKEIGRVYGVTAEAVRQVEEKALKKLKAHFNSSLSDFYRERI